MDRNDWHAPKKRAGHGFDPQLKSNHKFLLVKALFFFSCDWLQCHHGTKSSRQFFRAHYKDLSFTFHQESKRKFELHGLHRTIALFFMGNHFSILHIFTSTIVSCHKVVFKKNSSITKTCSSNQHKRFERQESTRHEFDLLNSCTFTLGTLTTKGWDAVPSNMASKIVFLRYSHV